jgi:MFS family permease
MTAEIRTLFRALRHRNFRLFWYGQLISLVGTWMQTTAQAWLVLDLTGSAFKLGVVTAMQFLPILLLSLVTGPLVDRFPKRRIIIITQSILAFQAIILALLVWTASVQYWHVVVLAAVLGVANTIDMPARQSFIIELVGHENLMNAVGLNSSIFNGARALGPALAGVLMASIGTAPCFFLNGFSYVPVLYSLLFLMRIENETKSQRSSIGIIEDTREALRFIRRSPVLRTTIPLVAVVSIFAANFNVLVPVFARLELHGDAADFGLLMSSFGFGALVGAVTFTYLSRFGPRMSLLFVGGVTLGAFLLVIGMQDSFDLTALLLGFCGWSIVTFFGMANTILQINSHDHLRGRVMSIYTMSFGGLSPVGSVLTGVAAHWLHAPLTFALGGLITIVCFVIAAYRVRSIVRE